MLNKVKGNMYSFVNFTWNPIKGKCSHDCKYCYMKVWKQKPLHLVEKELKDDLSSGNFIFVGSSCDMFADDVPEEWIKKVLAHCRDFNNKYLFQTKNPKKIYRFIELLPNNCVIGTTIESDINYHCSKSPFVEERIYWLSKIDKPKMITLEPIMDFNLEPFVQLLKPCKPKWINIGSDSKNHKLPKALITELKKFTEVKIKDNLKRLIELK